VAPTTAPADSAADRQARGLTRGNTVSMKQWFTKLVKVLLALLLVVALLVVGLVLVAKQGWLDVIGINSSTRDSQVVQAVTRTEEVSLLSLSVQGLIDESRSREVFGQTVPGSEEQVFLQYEFDAKLGFDAADVEVEQTADDAYTLRIPEFVFIGYAEPSFEVATTDGGVLSFVTPDIDELELVNELLSESSQATYLTENDDVLREQATTFYDSIFTSIDPAIETTYEFAS
jgi:cell division protein FtsL